MDVAQGLEAFATSERGLASDEARRRLDQCGLNELRESARTSRAVIFLRQFSSPLVYILLVAMAVSALLREYIDAGVIASVLVLDAFIGFVQEARAERSAEALRRLTVTLARVLRDRYERRIDARELVPGDIVLLEAGDRVPADCRIIHETSLETDESLLTGESTPVGKDAVPLPEETPLAERRNMAYMGTVVTRGRARGLVVATGAQTELGRIAGSLREIGRAETPLQQRVAAFARIIGLAVVVAGALGVAGGAAAGESPGDIFVLFVALSVAAIPEGLPVVLTVTLAIGVNRMARRNVVIRRLPAVETLGSCTVIGSDKTGTLTQNRMTVERIVTTGGRYAVTGDAHSLSGSVTREDGTPADVARDEALSMTLLAGALCNDAGIAERGNEIETFGDPTEAALLVSAARAGLFKDDIDERYPRVAEVPFDPERRWAATVHQMPDAAYVFVKGAPETVLQMCTDAHGPALDRKALLAEAESLAAAGMRVLAMAYRRVGPAADGPALDHVRDLRFAGMQGMMDPPRPEAIDAVRTCQDAGIKVLMITGDHATTALAIARKLGIAGVSDRALVGVELDRMDDAELLRAVQEVPVYARVSPQHKHRIVEALRSLGHVVAVTGDGVNDAPALKAADIGVAMGKSGTDVAKEAADMVVVDDNFASIVAAVEEGRIAFDNVRKVTFFLIATGAGTVLAVLASVVLGYDIPFVPAQLLWLNLVTNGVQDVALAFEPGERGVLRRKPRRRDEGIISPLLWERTAIVGTVLAAGTMLLYAMEAESGAGTEHARTVALTALVLFQVFHIGNSRSEHVSAFAKSPLSNPLLFAGTAIAVAVHVAALYLPPTQYVLRVEPLGAETWARIILVALSVVVAVELHKLWRGGYARYTGRAA